MFSCLPAHFIPCPFYVKMDTLLVYLLFACHALYSLHSSALSMTRPMLRAGSMMPCSLPLLCHLAVDCWHVFLFLFLLSVFFMHSSTQRRGPLHLLPVPVCSSLHTLAFVFILRVVSLLFLFILLLIPYLWYTVSQCLQLKTFQ